MTGKDAAFASGYLPAAQDGLYEAAIGPFHVRAAPEGAIYAFTVLETHLNMSGSVHGGMLGSFADTVLRQAAMAANAGEAVAPLSMSLSFMAAARVGDLIECRPEVIRQAAGVLFITGKFITGGVTILSASSLWETFRTRPEMAKKAKT